MTESRNKYLRDNYKSYTLRLNLETDSSIIHRLNQVPNITRYLVDLVNEDIERAKRFQGGTPAGISKDIRKYPYEVIDQLPGGYYVVGTARDLEDARMILINYVQNAGNVGMLSIIRRDYDPRRREVIGRIMR